MLSCIHGSDLQARISFLLAFSLSQELFLSHLVLCHSLNRLRGLCTRTLSPLFDTQEHLTFHHKFNRSKHEANEYQCGRLERRFPTGTPAHDEPGALTIKLAQQEAY